MDKLDVMMAKQRELQIESFGGVDPADLTGDARAEFIRWNVLALEDELHEALGEVGWKPWATSRHLNHKEYTGELVDALHFFLNLCLAADISAVELYEGYLAKRERNAKRQEDGYDGLSGKCPTCKRDLVDLHEAGHAHAPVHIVGRTFCSDACFNSYGG